VGVGESLAGGAYVNGLFVAATGSAAAAIDVVARHSQTAADVRTGHIANDAASDETKRSSHERTRSRTKRHFVHALSGAGRGRRKHGRHDDGHRKYLFFMMKAPLVALRRVICTRGLHRRRPLDWDRGFRRRRHV
jgi:hypothetical protein